MGWLQSIRKLGIHVQELHATVPQCTLHDGVGGHFWGIELQALRAEGGPVSLNFLPAISPITPYWSPKQTF